MRTRPPTRSGTCRRRQYRASPLAPVLGGAAGAPFAAALACGRGLRGRGLLGEHLVQCGAVRHRAVAALLLRVRAGGVVLLRRGGVVGRHAVLRAAPPARSPRTPARTRPIRTGSRVRRARRSPRTAGRRRREPDERRHRRRRVPALRRGLPRRPRLARDRVPGNRRARAGAVAHDLAEHLAHRRRGLLARSPAARAARDRLPVAVLVDRRVEEARRHGHAAVRDVAYTSTICIAVTATL